MTYLTFILAVWHWLVNNWCYLFLAAVFLMATEIAAHLKKANP